MAIEAQPPVELGSRRHRAALEQCPPDETAANRDGPEGDRGAQEAPPSPVRHLRRRSWLGRRDPQEQPQDPYRHRHGHPDHHERRDRLGQWVAQPGSKGQEPETPESDRSCNRMAPRQQADDRRRGQRHRHDEQVEHELVGLSEQIDHQLLRAGRLERDDQIADGDHRARGARKDPGQQLGDAQCHGTCDHSRHGGPCAGG